MKIGLVGADQHPYLVSAAVVIVRAMQGLVQIADKMDQKPQSLRPHGLRKLMVREDAFVFLHLGDDAIASQAVPHGVISVRRNLDVHVMPRSCFGTIAPDFIGPGGNLLHTATCVAAEKVGDLGARGGREPVGGDQGDDAVTLATPRPGTGWQQRESRQGQEPDHSLG